MKKNYHKSYIHYYDKSVLIFIIYYYYYFVIKVTQDKFFLPDLHDELLRGDNYCIIHYNPKTLKLVIKQEINLSTQASSKM